MSVHIPDNREELLSELKRLSDEYYEVECSLAQEKACDKNINLLKAQNLGVGCFSWLLAIIVCVVISTIAWIGIVPVSLKTLADRMIWWELLLLELAILYGVSFYKKYKRNEKVKVLEENYSNLQKRTTKLYNSIKNNFIPDRFASLMAVNYMYEAVKNGQADTFKEALIRCEEELRYQNTLDELHRLQSLQYSAVCAANNAARAARVASYESKK